MPNNYSNSELLPAPLRVTTYTEDDDQRHFQWVMSELDEDIIRMWDSSVNGKIDIIDVNEVSELVQSMGYLVTVGSAAAGNILDTENWTVSPDGAVTLITDQQKMFEVNTTNWNLNSLQILKNGIVQVKGRDVFLTETNKIQIMSRLQQEDTIHVNWYTGL